MKKALFHRLGKCKEIKNFWENVLRWLSEMFKVNVALSAKLCRLGIYPKHFPYTTKQAQMLDFGLLQARRAFALCWKSTDAPIGKEDKGTAELLRIRTIDINLRGWREGLQQTLGTLHGTLTEGNMSFLNEFIGPPATVYSYIRFHLFLSLVFILFVLLVQSVDICVFLKNLRNWW